MSGVVFAYQMGLDRGKKESEDRIKKLEYRLKKAIEIADDYAYAAGKWIDPDIDYEEFYSWKEELENETGI